MPSPCSGSMVAGRYQFCDNNEFHVALEACFGAPIGSDSNNYATRTGTCDNTHPTYGHISSWNISRVTDLTHAFYRATNFNGELSGWDTSSVTTMYNTFTYATNFN